MEIWGGNCAIDQNFRAPGIDISVYSCPYGESASGGGDIYYLTSCASGRISRFLLADVSGHGESVSDVAVQFRDLLRENVNTIKQERFVMEMNRKFGAKVGNDNFATALVATYFEPNRSLAISVAGHPYPIYFRHENQKWVHLDPAANDVGLQNLPLGIIDSSHYPGRTIETEKDDMFLLYTDAFIESVDENGQMLGIGGLIDLLNCQSGLTPQQTMPYLRESLLSLNENNLKEDDATLILGSFTSTRVRMRDNVMAPFRLARKTRDRTRISSS